MHINRDIIFFNYITEDIDKKNDVSDLSAPIDIEKKDNETLIKNCFLAKSITESSNVNLRSVWGKLIKRSFLISNNIFFDENVKIVEDMIFMLKIYSSLSSAFYVPSVIYHYHFSNPTSITNSFKPDLKIMIDCFNVSIAVWLILNPNYNIYFYNYRLNDLILYFKYDFFHKLNKSPKHNRKRMKQLFVKGEYKQFYNISKKNGLIKHYPFLKRLVFWLAIHNFYLTLRLIFKLKYN